MRRPFRPRLEALESRWNPVRFAASAAAAKFAGDFSEPHTDTEIMASVRSADPLGELTQLAAVDPRAAALIDPAASNVIFTLDGDALVEVRLAAGADPEAAARWLASYRQVVWVAPNAVFTGDPLEFTPDDPQFGSQYHLARMQLSAAWDVTTGDPAIIVAIADNGTAVNHPDLQANIYVNPDEIAGNGLDDDANGFVDDVNGWDFNVGDADPNPAGSDNHGTHTAGIVAARTNNATGVAGVAGGDGTADSGVRVMPLRWDGTNSWTAARVASTFTYAADNGAKIVSASYNFDGFATNATVLAAFDYSYSRGVLHVNSAGNGNSLSPPRASITHALFVASTDSGDVRSSFSDYGPYVDIAAPGSNVLATTASSNGTVFTYGSLSGTSMSAPNAAAVAALIWSLHPTWTREQVVAQLLATADSIDAQNPNFVGYLGTGRANAARALTEVLPAPRFGAVAGLPTQGGFVTAPVASFTITTPRRFDPATVLAANFELRGDGADGAFGTADDVVLPLTLNAGAAYRVGTNSLAFAVTGTMAQDRYRFTAKAGGLRDPFGTALDGDADGEAGGDFAREFTFLRQVNGTAYEDWDADGVRGPADPALAGVAVYADLDNDGVRDAAEPSGTSDAAGTYFLSGVAPGTYALRQVGLTGYSATGAATQTVTIADAGSSVFGFDFGQIRSAPAVYGRVFVDANANGAADAGETGQAGRVVYVDANANAARDTYAPQTLASADVPRAVANLATVSSTLPVSGLSGTITDVNVRLSITHPNVTDLDVFLVAPDGTRVELFTDVGSTGDNFTNTTLDTQAATAITAGTAPFAGTYRPEGSLSGFNGRSPNGTWTLQVTDDLNNSSTGTLTAWSIVVATAEVSATTDALGNYRLPLAGGDYALRLDSLAGWGATSPPDNLYAVTVAAGPVAGRTFGQRADAAAPSGTVAVGSGAQRSRVTQLTVAFDEVVTFVNNDPAAAFTLTRLGGGPVALNAVAAVVNGRTEVTLTFADGTEFGSLIDGRYTLTVDTARVRDLALNQLAPVGPTDFYRYYGDIDGDADVDGTDLVTYVPALFDPANYIAALDFDNDADIDGTDLVAFVDRLFVPLP